MPGSSLLAARLRAVRGEVDQVCGLLSAPSADALGLCTGILESACAGLAKLGLEQAGGAPEVQAEAYGLRESLARSSHLLRKAEEYHSGWIRNWDNRNANYSRSGAAAPPQRGLLFLAG